MQQLSKITHLIIDMDGVLYLGNQPMPGLCDFFAGDITSDLFLAMHSALTGFDYAADGLLRCGERIYALERHVNNLQGRQRGYDAWVPPKFLAPLTCGPHAGHAVDPARHDAILDAYYAYKRWTADGAVPPHRLAELGIAHGVGQSDPRPRR